MATRACNLEFEIVEKFVSDAGIVSLIDALAGTGRDHITTPKSSISVAI